MLGVGGEKLSAVGSPKGGKGVGTVGENNAYVAKMVPDAEMDEGRAPTWDGPSSASAQILGCIISRSDQRKNPLKGLLNALVTGAADLACQCGNRPSRGDLV